VAQHSSATDRSDSNHRIEENQDTGEGSTLRAAINAISDVVQNRPLPLREFDQIYMKTADMAMMAVFVAERFADQHIAFIGDGDAIALSVMHLLEQKLVKAGPKSIVVLDFDERIVNSITRFADKYQLSDRISAVLYNVYDPLPNQIVGSKDGFYTNPPWGQSNGGESVIAFMERGIEACVAGGHGAVVIADDPNAEWTYDVLLAVQRAAVREGFIVKEMVPEWHFYHLDDAPDLRSCAIVIKDVERKMRTSRGLTLARAKTFYGRESPLKFRYVRERETLNWGRASEETYELVPLETENG